MNNTISIIMPALNEEENIRSAIHDTLQAFKDFNIRGEIIVVNDGSTDRTEKIVRELILQNVCIKLINHNTSKGIGASFWEGVNIAEGEIISMFPGDNENDPWESLRYYPLLEHVDIIIPFVYNREVRPMFRNSLSFLYRFIINTTFLVNFNYTNGTVIYRKSVLEEFKTRSTGFFFQTDILIRTVKKGYLFAEVPYRLGLRKTGRSKAISFPSLFQVMKGYLRLTKDIYFSKNDKIKKRFSESSSTAKRYNNQ